jgi:hypothetical protein
MTTPADPSPATPRRIYLVRNTETAEERLVRAANPAQARSHAARAVFEVAVASQDQLVALLTGEEPVKVEDATQQGGGD